MLIDKYNRILIDKLPANIASEVNQIAADTDNFSDEELVEIYKDNFNDLFKIIESKHPEALKAKKKLVKKASEKKKIVKKAEPKKKLVKKSEPKKKIVKKSESKVPLKSLTIHWAEGDNSKYDKFPKEYKTWSAANNAVIPVYKDFAEDGGGGYNKVKFTALFEDGETYQGRLDVNEKEDNPTLTDSVFGLHIKQTLDYDLSDKSSTSEQGKKAAREFLEKYDLGLNSKKAEKKSEPIGPTGKDIDLSMLAGKEIDAYFEGLNSPRLFKIKSAKVDDAKFSNRFVTISTTDNSEFKFPLSNLESFLEGKEIKPKQDGDKLVIVLKNASEVDCQTAIAEVKAIHAKREAAAAKRAEAPKKKVTTAAREKQIKTIASVFKTKEFKADKTNAQGFAKDLVAVYSKYGLKSIADQLEKDIQELIDTKYK